MIKKDDVFELTREEIAYIIANSNSQLNFALGKLLDPKDPYFPNLYTTIFKDLDLKEKKSLACLYEEISQELYELAKKKSLMTVREWQGYKLHVCYDDSTWLILLNDLAQILKVRTGKLESKIGNKFKRLKYLKDEDDLPEDIYTFVTAQGMYQAILSCNSIKQATEFQDYVLSLVHYQWQCPNWDDGLTFLDWFYHLGREDKKKRRKQNEN